MAYDVGPRRNVTANASVTEVMQEISVLSAIITAVTHLFHFSIKLCNHFSKHFTIFHSPISENTQIRCKHTSLFNTFLLAHNVNEHSDSFLSLSISLSLAHTSTLNWGLGE